ncbi:hypothetical protein [Rubritalea profundi]|uniref:hypothetical protein n=1 Tax=Rubritalea profundi TaxID=1658618 RepID=UPI00101AD5C1|nr:hypothetical protein [Rubritalea profundi]
MKLTQLPIPTARLKLRTATEEAEVNLLRQTLNREYYLKAGRAAGYTIPRARLSQRSNGSLRESFMANH